jgi:hypothetical protein
LLRQQLDDQTWESFQENEMAQFTRIHTIATYAPRRLHPSLYDIPSWTRAFLAPELVAALAAPDPTQALLAICREEVAGGLAYSLPVLTDAACTLFVQELNHLDQQADIPKKRPNSMNNYGVVLDDMGMDACMDALMRAVVVPLTYALFPARFPHLELDTHHAFIVKYRADQDKALSTHVDTSDVTLNVSLNQEFSGCALRFFGMGPAAPTMEVDYAHVKGRGIIHPGKLMHRFAQTLNFGFHHQNFLFSLFVWTCFFFCLV